MENLKVYKLNKKDWAELGEIFNEYCGEIFDVDVIGTKTENGNTIYKCRFAEYLEFYITEKLYNKLIDINAISRIDGGANNDTSR